MVSLSIYDEEGADTIVKAVMLLHNKKVIILNGDNEIMGKVVLYKDEDGSVKKALNFEPITREEIEQGLEECQLELAELQQALADYDELTNYQPEVIEPVETPTSPEAQPIPQPEQPQPVQEPAPVQEVESAPVAQPEPLVIS